jgi:hypothetical protein
MPDSNDALSFDEYCIAVGRATHNAAACDFILFAAFCKISRLPDTAARAIYYTADAVAMRRAMIRRLTEVVGDGGLLDLVEEIGEAVTSAAKNRNQLAHSLISAGPEFDVTKKDSQLTRMNPKTLSNPAKRLVRQDADAIVEATSTACLKARQAYERLCSKLGVSPGLPSG